MEVFNPTSDTWYLAAPLPVPIGDSVVVALPDNRGLLVAGGEGKVLLGGDDPHTEVFVALHSVWHYLPEHDTWVERAPMPRGTFRGAGVYMQGAVHVLGG